MILEQRGREKKQKRTRGREEEKREACRNEPIARTGERAKRRQTNTELRDKANRDKERTKQREIKRGIVNTGRAEEGRTRKKAERLECTDRKN